ncbi:hypothetical protein GTHT12_02965 [Geobacillus thermodenitrificans]|jgi:hypothetical protein|nr:hypothetical protein GTHT12_02965 [Geobacillus thermodenitrificans]KQB91531.1 hypothetical protein GEPA3_3505 [Geobacillus sp. PA-3]
MSRLKYRCCRDTMSPDSSPDAGVCRGMMSSRPHPSTSRCGGCAMSRPPFFSENAHAIFMLRWKESLILDLFDIIAPPFFAPAHGNLIMKSVFDGETAVRCPDAATCCLIKKDKAEALSIVPYSGGKRRGVSVLRIRLMGMNGEWQR